MDLYMDEKWKLSRKGSCSYSKSRREPLQRTNSSGGAYLKWSSSMPDSVKVTRARPASKSSSSSAGSFTRRCANLVKEQRAKFYIVRRCVTMLIRSAPVPPITSLRSAPAPPSSSSSSSIHSPQQSLLT